MSSSTAAGNVLVVTHVHPIPQGAVLGAGNQKFSRGRPLELGTVQIMIGLVVLLLGIVMSIGAVALGVYSGVFVWGALFYIISGSLTVAAGKTFNQCLVKGALGLCVVSAVASCTGTILCLLDAVGMLAYCYASWYDCHLYLTLSQGVSGVMALLHFVELIVSVTVSGFACNATCNCDPEVTLMYCKNTVEPTPSAEPPPYTNVFGGVSVHNGHPAINP